MGRAHPFYLAALDLEGRPALVVGGDGDAAERAERLVDAGARVAVVWPTADARITVLARAGAVRWYARNFADADVRGARIVVVSVRDAELVARVALAARRAGAWLSAIDQLASSDIAQVAIARRGDLQIAVSSNGAAPGVARRVREGLTRGLEDARLDRLLAGVERARSGLLGRTMDERRAAMARWLDGLAIETTWRFPAWIERGDSDPDCVEQADTIGRESKRA